MPMTQNRVEPRVDDDPPSERPAPGRTPDPATTDAATSRSGGDATSAADRDMLAVPRRQAATAKPARPRRRVPAPLRWMAWALLILVAVSVGLIAPWTLINPPTSAFMVADALEHDRPITHEWTDWQAISDAMPAAVIAAEDQRFRQHFGFDVDAMREAWDAHQRGERMRGASTITQQTVKNLLLTGHRNYARKAVEAWLTVFAEALWTKRRTLEIYLNLAQFGDGLFGVEAAARHYFGKSAADLSRSDAAWLATLLPAPERYRIDPPTDYTRERHAWILGQMPPTVSD